jgi:hypothetical protein
MRCIVTGLMSSSTVYSLNAAYSLGCTFLDWSLQWLSGADSIYNCHQRCTIPLVSDPLTGNNAHGHVKNHPCGTGETLDTIQHLQQSPMPFNGFYPRAHETDWYAHDLGLDVFNLDQQQWRLIHQHQAQELRHIISCSQDNGVITVYVNVAPRWHLYFLKPRKIPSWLSHHADWISVLSERSNISSDLNAWDWRERLALDLRPFERPFDEIYVDQQRPHIWLEAEDIWINGEHCIPAVLELMGQEIDSDRLKSWQEIWHRWHRVQIRHLRFAWQLPGIIDAVIKDHDRILPELDIIEEAVVQHCLIYAHDVNIRNWQLLKLPRSARDLHQLLEPNQHNITDDTYRDLLRRSIDSLRSSI